MKFFTYFQNIHFTVIIGFSIKPRVRPVNIFYHLRIFYSDNPDLLTIINDMTCKNFLSLENSFYSDILDLLTIINENISKNFLSLAKTFNKNFIFEFITPRILVTERPISQNFTGLKSNKKFLVKKAVLLSLYHKTLKTK